MEVEVDEVKPKWGRPGENWKASWPLGGVKSRKSRAETARGQTEQSGPGGAAETRV